MAQMTAEQYRALLDQVKTERPTFQSQDSLVVAQLGEDGVLAISSGSRAVTFDKIADTTIEALGAWLAATFKKAST